VIIADTSGLLAFFDEDEDDHAAVRAVVDATAEQLVISPFVAAELGYLVAQRGGVTGRARRPP
jgi:predicted nucleic acid-binding protein